MEEVLCAQPNELRRDGRRWVVFLMLWPDIIQLGRVTSDVVRGMSVTQSVGHIATVESVASFVLNPMKLAAFNFVKYVSFNEA